MEIDYIFAAAPLLLIKNIRSNNAVQMACPLHRRHYMAGRARFRYFIQYFFMVKFKELHRAGIVVGAGENFFRRRSINTLDFISTFRLFDADKTALFRHS